MMVKGIQVFVKQPGIVIPGVELFTPCKESLTLINAYHRGCTGVNPTDTTTTTTTTPDSITV